MSAGNIFWLLVFIGMAGGYYFFILRGRTYGYQALATRVGQLHAQGISNVWLLYGNQGVGYNINLAQTSAWTLLNTGCLAYTTDQQFVIEFPWWNKMRPLLSVPISQLNFTRTTVMYARRTYPAIHIGYQSYVVLALNIEDVDTVKQLLKMHGHDDSEALLESFVSTLPTTQPTMNGDLVNASLSSESPKSSAWKVIRGTFLYFLLPCLLLTAAVILWAILTKQPVFQ